MLVMLPGSVIMVSVIRRNLMIIEMVRRENHRLGWGMKGRTKRRRERYVERIRVRYK